MEKKKVVIALGGNALGNNIQEQKEAVAKTAQVIVDLAAQGLELVVTHGNGPQVGMIQKAMDELATNYTDNYMETPLPTCVAMSQGYIGIDLQNAIKYELHRRGMDVKVSTILSQVEVDKNDEAFRNPTKPIGRFLTEEEAKRNQENGIPCMEDAGRGYRVVVASPMPKKIRELLTIKTLVDAGHIVITCGGGGIPVVDEDGKLSGVNAVIDKDNASSLLAAELGADYLIILTAVEKVAINFGKENQEWLSDLTVDQAKEYIAQEQFAKGSMLPKIEAAIRFAESGEGRRTPGADVGRDFVTGYGDGHQPIPHTRHLRLERIDSTGGRRAELGVVLYRPQHPLYRSERGAQTGASVLRTAGLAADRHSRFLLLPHASRRLTDGNNETGQNPRPGFFVPFGQPSECLSNGVQTAFHPPPRRRMPSIRPENPAIPPAKAANASGKVHL